NGYIPTMQAGDILGHEFMGEVVEVGKENHRLKPGDRVVVPANISCGRCNFCRQDLWSLCDNSNPNASQAERLYGFSPAAIYGFPERLRMAETHGHAETLNYTEIDSVLEALTEKTGGRGPDACIDAVGMEAHGANLMGYYDRAKQALQLQTDRPYVLRQAIQ